MTFEEHVKNCKDIDTLKDELLYLNSFIVGFEAYLEEKLGSDTFKKLTSDYAIKRANFWLSEMLRRNEA